MSPEAYLKLYPHGADPKDWPLCCVHKDQWKKIQAFATRNDLQWAHGGPLDESSKLFEKGAYNLLFLSPSMQTKKLSLTRAGYGFSSKAEVLEELHHLADMQAKSPHPMTGPLNLAQYFTLEQSVPLPSIDF